MSEFNFKSSVCTSREQSEKLLALGLKKETADMVYRSYGYIIDEFGNKERRFKQPTMVVDGWESKYDIPAWSLHRLWELANIKHIILDSQDEIAVLYDEVIMKIEQFIEEGNFPKEYLV